MSKSIQALRERRRDLAIRARKLIDDNPGARWSPTLSAELDGIYADIDRLDREIHEVQSGLDAEAHRKFGGSSADWIDVGTGEKISVAYAARGSLKGQLRGALSDQPGGERVHLGEFMRGVAGMKTTPAVQNALSVGTDASGGFAVPAEVQLDVLDAMVPVSSLLTAGAGVSILEPGAKLYRIAAVNAIPTAGWRAEAGAVADSEPTFTSRDLTPRSLAFKFKASRELLADAVPNFEGALRRVIAQALAKELDRAGLRGIGTPPEIRGIKNITGIQAVPNGANGASLATDAYADLVEAARAIRAADGPMPSAAIMSPRSLFILLGLLDTTNQPRKIPALLESWKMIDTSQVPNNLTVGTSTDCSEIYVGDFSTCAFFFREQMTIQRLNELYAGTGEIGFACHVRADFGAMYPAALALITGVRP